MQNFTLISFFHFAFVSVVACNTIALNWKCEHRRTIKNSNRYSACYRHSFWLKCKVKSFMRVDVTVSNPGTLELHS